MGSGDGVLQFFSLEEDKGSNISFLRYRQFELGQAHPNAWKSSNDGASCAHSKDVLSSSLSDGQRERDKKVVGSRQVGFLFHNCFYYTTRWAGGVDFGDLSGNCQPLPIIGVFFVHA